MPDPNPYDPPQTIQPSQLSKVARRGFSVAAIVVMAPGVAVIAGFIGWVVGAQAILAAGSAPGFHEGLLMLISTISFILTLAGMLRWAWLAHRRGTELSATKRADDA